MYLESIFGSPDIVRQLPAAAKMFQAVDKSWRHIMLLTADEPLAIKQVRAQPGAGPVGPPAPLCPVELFGSTGSGLGCLRPAVTTRRGA